MPEGVKLVAIMSSGAGSLRAKIYENGLKNVNEGDVLSEKYKVIKINKDNIKYRIFPPWRKIQFSSYQKDK
ncbi:hypothetical protein OIU92_31850 [Escherichia coli]|nr:hypothetical protein [Escherichia coli]